MSLGSFGGGGGGRLLVKLVTVLAGGGGAAVTGETEEASKIFVCFRALLQSIAFRHSHFSEQRKDGQGVFCSNGFELE